MDNKKTIAKLKELYPNPKCELNFNNIYELIVAVILSAQCTDKRVNIVTADLFKKYPTVQALANSNLHELEQDIKPCGFYHNKARNIKMMATDVVERFGGVVPSKKEDLISLAGVGEKTANVVLAAGYNVPAIAVDTHVFRVSNRLGLADAKTVEKTQAQLEQVLDKEDWINTHYSLVLHGRYVCKAINPQCQNCGLVDNCKYFVQNKKM